MLSVTKKNSRE